MGRAKPFIVRGQASSRGAFGLRPDTWLTAAFVLILLAPQAAAHPFSGPATSMAFDEVHVRGPAEVGGGLVALLAMDRLPTTSLVLSAQEIRSRTAFQASHITARGAHAVDDAGVRRLDLDGARLTGRPSGSAPSLGVFALDDGADFGLSWSSGHVRTEAAGRAVEARHVGSPIPLVERSTASTLHLGWAAQGTAPIEVSGSFMLVLWDWDIAAKVRGTEVSLRSGTAPMPVDSPPVLATGTQMAQQVYLEVRSGHLRLEGLDAAGLDAWTTSARLETPGPVTLARASEGATHSSHFAAEPDHGLLQIGMRHEAGRAMATVTGGFPLSQDAAAAARLETAPRGASSPWLVALIGAAIAPAGGAVIVSLNRRLEATRLGRLEAAYEAGDTDGVLKWSEGLLGSKDFSEDAALMRLEAMVRLDRIEEALPLLDATGRLGELQSSAAIAYAHALVCAMRGDHAQAARDIVRSLQHSSDFYDDILDEPALRLARLDPAVRQELARISRGQVNT